MFKTLFFIFTLTSAAAQAEVSMKWLSVASVVIDDGKTQILFDPAFTRPTLMHWMNLKKFKSEESLVDRVLQENKLDRVKAVFVSHSHFDHSVDAPMVSYKTGATFYADKSQTVIAQAYNFKTLNVSKIVDGSPILIGDFKVIPVKREHSKILHLFDFLPGDVPSHFDFNFYDYHLGETWLYVIKHPQGIIVVDQGSEPFIEKVTHHALKVDALIQGVANRRSNETIIAGYVKKFIPKIFIPSHFDNFFFSFSPKEESLLPGIKLAELLDEMRKTFPQVNVRRPIYGEKIVLLEGKGELAGDTASIDNL
jgi:L-ascorbate metabolism protein UlaG (beta-lactamase superfamily)